jgi:hypothetical protein
VQLYIDGTRNGDAAKLRDAFHDECSAASVASATMCRSASSSR